MRRSRGRSSQSGRRRAARQSHIAGPTSANLSFATLGRGGRTKLAERMTLRTRCGSSAASISASGPENDQPRTWNSSSPTTASRTMVSRSA